MELCTLKAIHHPLRVSTSSHSHLLKPSICHRQILISRAPGLLSRSIYLSDLPLKATTSEETPGGSSWYVDEKQDEKRDDAINLGDVTTTDKKAFNETLTFVDTEDESLVDEQVQPFDSADRKAFNETLVSIDTEDESSVDEQVQPFDSTDKKAYNETLASEETKDKSPVEEEVQPLDFLDNLKIKFGTDDTTSLLLYGGGAIAALWLTASVVSAIDSIPLFPKLLEVVGLGYTLWFSSRYLLFKKNRDELAVKVEELKEQVLGSEQDE